MTAIRKPNRTKDTSTDEDGLEFMEDIIAAMYGGDTPMTRAEYDDISEVLDFDDEHTDMLEDTPEYRRQPPKSIKNTGVKCRKGAVPVMINGTHEAILKFEDDWPAWFYESTEAADQEGEVYDSTEHDYFWRFCVTDEESSAYPALKGLSWVDVLSPIEEDGKYRILAY